MRAAMPVPRQGLQHAVRIRTVVQRADADAIYGAILYFSRLDLDRCKRELAEILAQALGVFAIAESSDLHIHLLRIDMRGVHGFRFPGLYGTRRFRLHRPDFHIGRTRGTGYAEFFCCDVG